jgi:hypothetical protein
MIGNYIKAVAVAVSRSSAKLMKTGQTTSYRTGDDGDLEAGRNTSFTVLAENNPFGNTNRFTDELGGQTYTNQILIDWSTFDGSTVLGYRKLSTLPGYTWIQAIDAAAAFSIGIFTTGWRLSNINEISNILNYGTSANFFNYAPLNAAPFNFLGSAGDFWTSNTNPSNTSESYKIRQNNNTILNTAKINFNWPLAVRNFTVTGTTLS